MTTEKQLEILEQFKKWIYKLSFKYGAMSNNYLEPEDLVSIGQMAALEAHEKYNPDNFNGAKLNTYVMTHIKHRMQSAIRNCGDLNSSQQNAMIMISAMLKRLGNEGATPEEISAHSQKYYPKGSSYSWSIKQTKNYMELYNIRRYSTDFWTHNSDENAGAQAQKYALVSDTNIEDELNECQEKKLLYDAIDRLKPQFKTVMLGRLAGKTLDEVGQELMVTRERIRQIESLAQPIVIRLAQGKKLLPGQSKHLDKTKKKITIKTGRFSSRTPNISMKPQTVEIIVPVLPIINFDMEHGDMIFKEEYKLSPSCFKILQFLKTNTSSNKPHIAKGIDCSVKSLYDNLKVLTSLNYIDDDLTVLPREKWIKLEAAKKDSDFVTASKELIKKSIEKIYKTPIPIEPPTSGNKIESTCGKIYTISEDLGGRYEVYDPSVGKYTILKENEVKRIF